MGGQVPTGAALTLTRRFSTVTPEGAVIKEQALSNSTSLSLTHTHTRRGSHPELAMAPPFTIVAEHRQMSSMNAEWSAGEFFFMWEEFQI